MAVERVLSNLNLISFKTEGGLQNHIDELQDGDLVFTPDNSLKGNLFDFKWTDHKLNDISWLNADTFSWQSGDVYKAAYNHLVDDFENRVGKGTDTDGWLSETIDGVLTFYVVAPDGHKICIPDNEVNVQALYEKTGIAWYYILDRENKRFKLPRTKFGFTGLRDTVGKYVPAGVPNISGQFYIPATYGSTTASGAFTATNGGSTGSTNTASKAGDLIVEISASRSSSVYGSSDTVQPKATQMYLYFYVGNFEREAIEQTAGITSEQLNNKLDKSAETYLVPTGSVTAFAGTSAPAGWLKCDGSAISRTKYAKLFAAIGGNYGTGDGSTTFNLPDLTGRVPLGMLGSYVGQSSNGVLPNITGSLYGAKGGSNPSGTGAIAVYGQNYEGTYGSGGGQYYSWDFNAARSNSMYGNGWFDGARVIPSSVGMTYCIKY